MPDGKILDDNSDEHGYAGEEEAAEEKFNTGVGSSQDENIESEVKKDEDARKEESKEKKNCLSNAKSMTKDMVKDHLMTGRCRDYLGNSGLCNQCQAHTDACNNGFLKFPRCQRMKV